MKFNNALENKQSFSTKMCFDDEWPDNKCSYISIKLTNVSMIIKTNFYSNIVETKIALSDKNKYKIKELYKEIMDKIKTGLLEWYEKCIECMVNWR